MSFDPQAARVSRTQAVVDRSHFARMGDSFRRIRGRQDTGFKPLDSRKPSDGETGNYSGRFTITLVAFTVATASIPGFSPS